MCVEYRCLCLCTETPEEEITPFSLSLYTFSVVSIVGVVGGKTWYGQGDPLTLKLPVSALPARQSVSGIYPYPSPAPNTA